MFARLRGLCIVFFLFARFSRARLFIRANSPFPRMPNVFAILGALAKNAIFARAFGY